MSFGALSVSQFDPSGIGPDKAKTLYETSIGAGRTSRSQREQDRRKYEGDQGQLFSTAGTSHTLEPHQQTREQFAKDPRTWWHGRHSEALPTKAGEARNAGIHFGTLASAHQRKQKLGPSHKKTSSGEMQPYRFFPIRLAGEAVNTPAKAGQDEGNSWAPKPGHYFYKNQVEDPGHVSVKAPDRKAVMTHGDFIKAAGKGVHPMIAWENKAIGKQYDPGIKTGEQLIQEDDKRRSMNHVLQPRLFAPEDHGTVAAMARRRDLLEGAGLMTDSLSGGKMQRSPKTQDASTFLRYGYMNR